MEQIIGSEQTEDIIDVTAQNFMQEVIEASKQKAVIVQFWAPLLLLLLQTLGRASKGRWRERKYQAGTCQY